MYLIYFVLVDNDFHGIYTTTPLHSSRMDALPSHKIHSLRFVECVHVFHCIITKLITLNLENNCVYFSKMNKRMWIKKENACIYTIETTNVCMQASFVNVHVRLLFWLNNADANGCRNSMGIHSKSHSELNGQVIHSHSHSDYMECEYCIPRSHDVWRRVMALLFLSLCKTTDAFSNWYKYS